MSAAELAVDASALLAVLLDEADAQDLEAALAGAARVAASPVNIWEAAVRARAMKGPRGLEELHLLLARMDVRIESIDAQQLWHAVEAAGSYGRGTPASLNLGDCFAYALAKAENLPLLYKGEDFPRTDIRSAL